MSIRKKRPKKNDSMDFKRAKDESEKPVEADNEIPETNKSEDELLHPEKHNTDSQPEVKQKKPMKRRTKIILIIIAVVVVCCIISAITGGSDTTETATDETTATETTEATEETTEETKAPRKAEMPDVTGMGAEDAVELLQDTGFQDISVKGTNDIDIPLNDPAISAYVVKEQDQKADKKIKTSEPIVLSCQTEASAKEAKQMEALYDKLATVTAWSAVKEYGQDQYPFGFKIKTGSKLPAELKDKDTWHLKGTCVITNEYNADETKTVEADVTGTDERPDVVDFMVY